MTFKEGFADDLQNVFFDLDEFASEHVIDGKTYTCVITRLDQAEAKMSYGLMHSTLNPKEHEINKATHVIYLRTADISRKLSTRANIRLDGKNMFIWDIDKVEGVTIVYVGDFEM